MSPTNEQPESQNNRLQGNPSLGHLHFAWCLTPPAKFPCRTQGSKNLTSARLHHDDLRLTTRAATAVSTSKLPNERLQKTPFICRLDFRTRLHRQRPLLCGQLLGTACPRGTHNTAQHNTNRQKNQHFHEDRHPSPLRNKTSRISTHIPSLHQLIAQHGAPDCNLRPPPRG